MKCRTHFYKKQGNKEVCMYCGKVNEEEGKVDILPETELEPFNYMDELEYKPMTKGIKLGHFGIDTLEGIIDYEKNVLCSNTSSRRNSYTT